MIDTTLNTLPEDLHDLPFDHPRVLARFEHLIANLRNHPTYRNLSHILLGNEVDA